MPEICTPDPQVVSFSEFSDLLAIAENCQVILEIEAEYTFDGLVVRT